LHNQLAILFVNRIGVDSNLISMSNLALQRIDGSGFRFHSCGKLEHPSSLVLLLHGSGSHAANLLPLATRLAAVLPDTLFVLADAPLSNREILSPAQVAAAERERPDIDWEQSRNWVRPNDSASEDPQAQRQAFLDMIRPPLRGLSRLADLLLARYALPGSAFAIYGFSQGGMIALYLGLDRDPACAGVICHSGQFFGGTEPRSQPRTLLIVGAQELEPLHAMSQVYPMAVKALRKLDIPFEEHLAAGLRHGFNADVVERIGGFLAAVLPAADSVTN
jgi:phospholipase/carboxylesterase